MLNQLLEVLIDIFNVLRNYKFNDFDMSIDGMHLYSGFHKVNYIMGNYPALIVRIVFCFV